MDAVRLTRGILVLALLGALATARASSPPRPTEGHGSNFHLLLGVESLDFDLDPRGSEEFVAAGLDPRSEEGGVVFGVGWVFRRPLRLDLTATGWRLAVDRPEVECYLARAAAELHLALAEGAVASLEATFSASFLILNYAGLGEDETMPGSSVGLGATGRLRLVGPLGLAVTYQYQLGRFQPKTFQLDDQEPFRLQPTSRQHGLRVQIHVDL